MEVVKDFFGWIMGLVISLFATFFGFFRWISSEFDKRDESIKLLSKEIGQLSEKVSDQDKAIAQELGVIKQEAALNAERDRSNQALILSKLQAIADKQDEQSNIIKGYQKQLDRLYSSNPELKKPEV